MFRRSVIEMCKIVQILMHHKFNFHNNLISVFTYLQFYLSIWSLISYTFLCLYISWLQFFVLFILNRHDFDVSLFVFSDLKISTMREEEKALKQKLCEMEKAKKQLQCDLASRDRTIQQLRVVSSERSLSDCAFF